MFPAGTLRWLLLRLSNYSAATEPYVRWISLLVSALEATMFGQLADWWACWPFHALFFFWREGVTRTRLGHRRKPAEMQQPKNFDFDFEAKSLTSFPTSWQLVVGSWQCQLVAFYGNLQNEEYADWLTAKWESRPSSQPPKVGIKDGVVRPDAEPTTHRTIKTEHNLETITPLLQAKILKQKEYRTKQD